MGVVRDRILKRGMVAGGGVRITSLSGFESSGKLLMIIAQPMILYAADVTLGSCGDAAMKLQCCHKKSNGFDEKQELPLHVPSPTSTHPRIAALDETPFPSIRFSSMRSYPSCQGACLLALVPSSLFASMGLETGAASRRSSLPPLKR